MAGSGPFRPANIHNENDLYHVINQTLRETNYRINSVEAGLNKTSFPVRITFKGGLQVGGGDAIQAALHNSTSLTFGAIGAGTCVEQPIPVGGAKLGGTVFTSPSAALGSTNLSWSGWVSTVGIVSVRVCNPTGGSITPNPVVWHARVFQ